MKLDNTFEVPVPVDQAWRILMDVPRVARCLPGASLDSHDGDAYQGRVRVKIGSITASYQGQATVTVLDEAQRTALVKASGREQRGAGRASAEVHMRLVPADAQRTRVELTTELAITGRAAQFGRGILGDVSSRLIDQFARNLAGELADSRPSRSPEQVDAPESQTEDNGYRPHSPDPAPLDLLDVVLTEHLRRRAARSLAVVAVLLVGLLIRRTIATR